VINQSNRGCWRFSSVTGDISSHACCGGYTWKTYAFDLTCPTVTSGVGTTTACSMSMHNVANNASTLSWTAGDILTVTISLRATNSSSYARAAALTLFKVPA
jgi:hypothetical protein